MIQFDGDGGKMVVKTNRLEKIKTATQQRLWRARLGSSRMLKQLTNLRYRIRYGYVLPKKKKETRPHELLQFFLLNVSALFSSDFSLPLQAALNSLDPDREHLLMSTFPSRSLV